MGPVSPVQFARNSRRFVPTTANVNSDTVAELAASIMLWKHQYCNLPKDSLWPYLDLSGVPIDMPAPSMLRVPMWIALLRHWQLQGDDHISCFTRALCCKADVAKMRRHIDTGSASTVNTWPQCTAHASHAWHISHTRLHRPADRGTTARAAVQQVDGCHVVDSVQAQPLLLPLLVTAVVSDNGASVAMSVGVSARWPCSGLHQPAAGLG